MYVFNALLLGKDIDYFGFFFENFISFCYQSNIFQLYVYSKMVLGSKNFASFP